MCCLACAHRAWRSLTNEYSNRKLLEQPAVSGPETRSALRTTRPSLAVLERPYSLGVELELLSTGFELEPGSSSPVGMPFCLTAMEQTFRAGVAKKLEEADLKAAPR